MEAQKVPVASGTVQRIRNLFETPARNASSQCLKQVFEPGALGYNKEENLSFPRSALMEMALHYRELCKETGQKELFICTDILKIEPCEGSGESSVFSLDEIRALPGNETCADCNSYDTSWASTNLGVFLCIRCSGVHRSIGVHITQILSCTLDIWTSDLVRNMERLGNRRVNDEYEYHVMKEQLNRVKLNPESSMQERQLYIKAKYISKDFHKSCKEPKCCTYALRRTKLMKSRIMSTSQTNLRTDLLQPFVVATKSNSDKGMMQYCGIVFISVISLNRNRKGKKREKTVRNLGGTSLMTPSFVTFSLGKQIEYYKDFDKYSKQNSGKLKLNLPLDDKTLSVALLRRSRLKQGKSVISQVIFNLSDVKYKGETIIETFTFPESKTSVEFSITIELLN